MSIRNKPLSGGEGEATKPCISFLITKNSVDTVCAFWQFLKRQTWNGFLSKYAKLLGKFRGLNVTSKEGKVMFKEYLASFSRGELEAVS